MFQVALLAVTVAATPPPQIYHIITRPLCSELQEHIKPAIGMMLQNDATIKRSPALFKAYNAAGLYGNGAADEAASGPGADPGATTSNGAQKMALLGMENLIRPVADNIIAIQTVLDSPALRVGTGSPVDDKQLQAIREKLLKALAAQNASLDIISGFVDTQQMADLQHSGEEYISAIDQPDTKNAGMATPTPNPLMSNPNYAGLAPNPYSIDLTTIPGLALGYNPVKHLIDGLHWTIDQTQARESAAATDVMSSAALCNAPPPSPRP